MRLSSLGFCLGGTHEDETRRQRWLLCIVSGCLGLLNLIVLACQETMYLYSCRRTCFFFVWV